MRLAEIYCTPGQAAEMLHVNRLTIQRWVKTGRIGGERVGNVTLIPLADIRRELADKRHELSVASMPSWAYRAGLPL